MRRKSALSIVVSLVVVAVVVAGARQLLLPRKPSVPPPNYDYNVAIVEREKAAGREIRVVDVLDVNFEKEQKTEVTSFSASVPAGQVIKFRFHTPHVEYGRPFGLNIMQNTGGEHSLVCGQAVGVGARDAASGELVHEAFVDAMKQTGKFDIVFSVFHFPDIVFKDGLTITPTAETEPNPSATK